MPSPRPPHQYWKQSSALNASESGMSIKTMDDLFVATSRTSTTPKNIQTCDRAEPRASEPKTRTKSGGLLLNRASSQQVALSASSG